MHFGERLIFYRIWSLICSPSLFMSSGKWPDPRKLWQIVNLFTHSCLWKENSGSSHRKVPLPVLKKASNKVQIEVNKTTWKYKTISECMAYCHVLLQITPNGQILIESHGWHIWNGILRHRNGSAWSKKPSFDLQRW